MVIVIVCHIKFFEGNAGLYPDCNTTPMSRTVTTHWGTVPWESEVSLGCFFGCYLRLRDDRNIRLVLMQTMLKVSHFGHYPEGICQQNLEAPRVRATRCCMWVEREHGDLWRVLWVKNPWTDLDHFREKVVAQEFFSAFLIDAYECPGCTKSLARREDPTCCDFNPTLYTVIHEHICSALDIRRCQCTARFKGAVPFSPSLGFCAELRFLLLWTRDQLSSDWDCSLAAWGGMVGCRLVT